MKLALPLLTFFVIGSLPAFSQSSGDEGRYFHLKPPSYSIPSARKHAIHKYAQSLRWYKEHLGDKPLVEGTLK